jgi:dihydrodipicolinate synthase/N-acetylneuraminate lyase
MSDGLRGVWVAMPTPWTADGRIDGAVVRELVGRYQVAGLHGAYTTGTDGEMHVLDLPEFTALAEAFGQATAAAMLPAQMGCTWSHTDGVVERARIARANGIDTIQVALPSWVPLNDDEIVRFFAAMAESVPEIRIVHYNIARAGRFFGAREYRMVADVAPGLVGSKHTGGDVASLIEIVGEGPPLAHFVVDTQVVPGALFGAKGFYSFLANLSPVLALELWGHCERGEWAAAARLRERIDALFRRWREVRSAITASPALGKVATAAGVYPEMPLAVRAPYGSGAEADVAVLRELVTGSFPGLVMD